MANISQYLLGAIALAFIAQLVTGLDDGPVTRGFDFDPLLAFSEPWRFITSMFLHGGFEHILFNALALFMFGSILDRKVSARDFILIYFGAGIVGGLLYYATYLLGIIPPIPALGASGAIYGILGAVAILLPDLQIFFYFIPMKIRYAVILWIAIEFLGTFDIGSGIASAAHLGGLVFGLAYGWYLKSRPQAQAPAFVYKTSAMPSDWSD